MGFPAQQKLMQWLRKNCTSQTVQTTDFLILVLHFDVEETHVVTLFCIDLHPCQDISPVFSKSINLSSLGSQMQLLIIALLYLLLLLSMVES